MSKSINVLPLEIIQDIFTLSCGRVVIRIPRLKGYVPRNITTQETISLVCSKWREIAVNTSKMWNSLTVMFCAFLGVDLDHALENVQNWLNRARTSSISLSIIIYGADELHVCKIRRALFSYQIQHLDLQSVGTFLVPSDSSCHLRSLSLTYELSEPWRATKRSVFPTLPILPSLKALQLFLHPMDFTDHRNIYTIPWHQLSVFDNSYTYWPSRICLLILRQCQDLIQCTLWMFVAQQIQYEVEDDIVLPNLEILNLNFDWRGSVDHILRPLVLPNVKSLDIISRSSKIPLDQTTIELIARRSGSKRLTTFVMPNTSNSVRVDSLLQHMPALRSVELGGPVTLNKRIFHDLSLGIIGPHLEDIQFKGLNSVEIVLMLRAIRERHVYAMVPGPSQIKPFKSVILYCTCDSDIKPLGKEAERCSEELNIRVAVVSSVAFRTRK